MKIASAVIVLFTTGGSLCAQDAIVLRHFDGWVGGVAFSADSRYLATASGDGTVRVHDLTKEKPDRIVRKFADVASAVAFSPKGNMIAAASFDGTVEVEALDSDFRTTPRQQRGAILALAFDADGKSLATGGMDGTIVVSQPRLSTRKVDLKLHQSWVNALAFKKDGILASGSSDNTVRLWQEQSGKWTEFARFDFPEGEVRSLAFSPDGKTLVAGVRYGTIKIIDVPTKKITTKKSHAADVWAVAFSPDGKTLASGDGDWDRPGDVRLWDTTTWKEKKLLKTTGEVLSLAYSPDGRYLAAGCWDKTVHLWQMDKR